MVLAEVAAGVGGLDDELLAGDGTRGEGQSVGLLDGCALRNIDGGDTDL